MVIPIIFEQYLELAHDIILLVSPLVQVENMLNSFSEIVKSTQ
jgi:hypothetical protein